MLDHIIFLFYIIIILISTIGFGYLFGIIFLRNLEDLNFGYLGIIGFFAVILIATISSFFVAHNFIHNVALHTIGVSFFLFNFLKEKENNIKQFKILLLILFTFLIGVYIFKNHDDFPYYHLTYALNLSENKYMIGTGLFSHGFRTSSSIFQYHSILYLPYIKYYLFHSGPFFILIYFNYIIITKLIYKYKKDQFDITYFFSILNFTFVNVAFYRIAEHGTDRSAQILLFLVFITFFEIIFIEKDKNKKNNLFNFLLITIFLAASMKVLFIIYVIFVPIIYFKNLFFKDYSIKDNIKIIIVVIFSFSLTLSNSFFSTGCLVYPETKTCFFDKFEWSIPEKEVKRMKTHYEWWAKAGGSANYRSEIKPEEYVKNFVWFKDWVDRHFFNKVSDTLLGIIFIGFLNIIVFNGPKKENLFKRKTSLINFVLFLFFLEWFLKHPSMRYGGYILFALPIFIYTSKKIETFRLSKKKILFSTSLIILLSIIVYNGRNISRLNIEVNKYDPAYNILKSPFFKIENAPLKVSYEDKEFKIYTPTSNMCWASPTPCSYLDTIKAKNWYGFKLIQRSDKW